MSRSFCYPRVKIKFKHLNMYIFAVAYVKINHGKFFLLTSDMLKMHHTRLTGVVNFIDLR